MVTWRSLHFGVIRQLVVATMIQVIRYALIFARMSLTQMSALDAIVARPLRLVLGLPRSAETLSVLIESGIPTTANLRKAVLVKFICKTQQLSETHPSRVLLS